MNDDEIQREFDRKVKQIIDNILRQERESIEAARSLLDQARKDVIAKLAETGRTEFDLYWLRSVRSAIESRITQLNRDMEIRLKGDIAKAFDLGIQLIDESAKVVLGANPIIGVSRQVAEVAASFSASLIKDLTTAAQASIDGVLQRAAVGGLTVQDAIKQIGASLDDSKTFSSIAARAETIFRTEVLRIQSIAAQARMQANREAMRRAGWALGKRWLATPDKRVRLSHLAAMGQEREVDEPFKIGGEELMYPRDPGGSAGETINCRCVSQPTTKRIFKIDRTKKLER
jgi:hypothetical protein